MSNEQGVIVEKWLKAVLLAIADDKLLPTSYYRSLDCDAALDAVDSDAIFEAEWLRLSEKLKRLWALASVGKDLAELAEDIRRESFLVVSRATRQHEIAGYVSDDFDLVVRARIVGMEDIFLDRLWKVYEGGAFPSPLTIEKMASNVLRSHPCTTSTPTST